MEMTLPMKEPVILPLPHGWKTFREDPDFVGLTVDFEEFDLPRSEPVAPANFQATACSRTSAMPSVGSPASVYEAESSQQEVRRPLNCPLLAPKPLGAASSCCSGIFREPLAGRAALLRVGRGLECGWRRRAGWRGI